MSCIYCGQYGTHHSRCPLYEPPIATHYCSICDEGIYGGEEYIENDFGEYAHWDCFLGARDLAEWLGIEIKNMEDDYY